VSEQKMTAEERLAKVARERDEARAEVERYRHLLREAEFYGLLMRRERDEARAEVARLRALVPQAWQAGRDYLFGTPTNPRGLSLEAITRLAVYGEEVKP
jgi:multidrug resistance efflux pump